MLGSFCSLHNFLKTQEGSSVLEMKNQSKNTFPMSLGPEINHSLLRGICRNFRRLKSYLVTNPMWRDGERRVVVEAPKPTHNFNSRTFHPSCFFFSPSLSVCTDNCSKRCQLAKATQRRRKVSARSNPGELKKKGRLRFLSHSLSLCLSNNPVS